MWAAYASNPEMLASVEHGAKNRLATVFFYLNNVTDEADVSKGGGQTNFPRAATAEFPHGGPQPRDYFDCSKVRTALRWNPCGLPCAAGAHAARA